MMSEAEILHLHVNDKIRQVTAEAGSTLLTILRDELRIISPKRGCNQGVCGSCTVLIDGYPQRACLTLAAACEYKTVRTVDSLSDDSTMIALQTQFRKQGAIQCGFCTSGMLISAWHLLQENQEPSAADIRSGLSGNLCRCTGYQKIIESVATVSEGGST